MLFKYIKNNEILINNKNIPIKEKNNIYIFV